MTDPNYCPLTRGSCERLREARQSMHWWRVLFVALCLFNVAVGVLCLFGCVSQTPQAEPGATAQAGLVNVADFEAALCRVEAIEVALVAIQGDVSAVKAQAGRDITGISIGGSGVWGAMVGLAVLACVSYPIQRKTRLWWQNGKGKSRPLANGSA